MGAGYFDNQLTRHLLGLDEGEIPYNTGTYGWKEPGQRPVPFSLLREEAYDCRLLPFVPQNTYLMQRELALHKLNKQWKIKADSLRTLKKELNQARIDAQSAASNVPLSLPSYTLQLVPKLLYQSNDDRPFPYQFQHFFDPHVLRIRWTRIGRNIVILNAYTNLCLQIKSDGASWDKGMLVGLMMDVAPLSEKDIELLQAFQFLGVPIHSVANFGMLEGYSLEDAHNALLGRRQGKATVQVLFDPSPEFLDGTDDDTLDFETANPNYDKDVFRTDGVTKSRSERRADRIVKEDMEAFGSPNQVMKDLEGTGVDTPSVSVAAPRLPAPEQEPTRDAETSSALRISLGGSIVAQSSSSAPTTTTSAFVSPAWTVSVVSSTSSSSINTCSGSDNSSRQR